MVVVMVVMMIMIKTSFIYLFFYRELLGGEKEGPSQLPSDKALLNDSAFCPFVEKYAEVCFFFSFSSSGCVFN